MNGTCSSQIACSFVVEGREGPRPWEHLRGQIFLSSEDFMAQHQPDRVMREIPRRQTHAKRSPLREVFQRRGGETRLIYTAYRQHGDRLAEIADHLGVHDATVSRRLKHAEQADA